MNCTGVLAHGNACGICKKCEREKKELEAKRPVSLIVTETVLDHWAAIAEDQQLQEIIRLAYRGLWAERFENPIILALTKEMDRQRVGAISIFERCLDAHPGRNP